MSVGVTFSAMILMKFRHIFIFIFIFSYIDSLFHHFEQVKQAFV